MSELQRHARGDDAHRFAPAAPDEDLVYGACAPGWHSAAGHDEALRDWLRFMERRDVERVCCLLPGRKLDTDESNVDHYREAFGPQRVLHAPTPDQRLVGERLLAAEILPFLDDATAADEPVVVHCLTGVCRTGQVLAAWLAHDRDYGPGRAAATVERMGRMPDATVRSGEVDESELRDLLATFA